MLYLSKITDFSQCNKIQFIKLNLTTETDEKYEQRINLFYVSATEKDVKAFKRELE